MISAKLEAAAANGLISWYWFDGLDDNAVNIVTPDGKRTVLSLELLEAISGENIH